MKPLIIKIHRHRSRGARGAPRSRPPPPPTPVSEIVKFFGQNVHDSGNNTWEKTTTLKEKRKTNFDCLTVIKGGERLFRLLTNVFLSCRITDSSSTVLFFAYKFVAGIAPRLRRAIAIGLCVNSRFLVFFDIFSSRTMD